MAAPDPQLAFVAFLRTIFPGWAVNVDLFAARPAVVVSLTPGGLTMKRREIDSVRLDLVCYGDQATDPRNVAAQVRAAVTDGFAAGGMSVFNVTADPPYPLVDPATYETRWYVATSARLHALPS